MDWKTGSFAGVAVTILVWGFVWALPGGVIEAIDNIAASAHGFTRQVDMWPQTLGLPGLVGGVIFSILLRLAAGGRRLAELSLSASAAWGAVAGLLAGVFTVWVLYVGLSSTWGSAAVALAYATAMGAIAGAVTPVLFHYAATRRFSATGPAEH